MRYVILLFALTAPVWGDPARFALVIGNGDYEGEMALANPSNDAHDMATGLASLGWEVSELTNADRRQIIRTLAEFRARLAALPGSDALFFYAGHGVEVGGQNYLIPVRESFATEDDVVSEAVSLASVQSAFDDGQVATSIILLDACRDNPFGKAATRSLSAHRGLSVVQKASGSGGSAIMFATAPGQTAADGGGPNGVFTQALLRYLPSGLPLQTIVTKVTADVKMLTAGKQVPYSSLSLSDEYYLLPGKTRVSSQGGAPSGAQASRVALSLQKAQLVRDRERVRASRSWAGPVGWLAWGTAVAGAGLAGYAYWGGVQAAQQYSANDAERIQSEYDRSRAQMSTMNLWFVAGQILAASGVAAGMTSLLFGPDTSAVDGQIRELDQQITLLGDH